MLLSQANWCVENWTFPFQEENIIQSVVQDYYQAVGIKIAYNYTNILPASFCGPLRTGTI